MASLLALDFAEKAGFAAWCERDPPVWGSMNFAKFAKGETNPDGAVMAALRDWLYVLIARYDPVWISVERPFVHRKASSRTITRLHGMFSVAAMVAAERKINWRETETWTVEKHFLGKSGHRSEQKKALTRQMCETLGWRPVTPDEADALAVLSWMQASVLPQQFHAQGPLLSKSPAHKRTSTTRAGLGEETST